LPSSFETAIGKIGPKTSRLKGAIPANRKPVTRPRPGHADLAGAIKYDFPDARYILERASARETTARVAIGALAKQFLREFGIEVLSHVVAVGSERLNRLATWDEIVDLSRKPRCCSVVSIRKRNSV
jgi:chorismate synthase